VAAIDSLSEVAFWKYINAEKQTRAISDTRSAYSTRLAPASPVNRCWSRLVEIEPDAVSVGLAVEVVFEQVEDIYLPLFKPADGRVPVSITDGESA